MEIKVLGTGCAGCKALYETTKQAVEELALNATVVKEEDIMKIMSYQCDATARVGRGRKDCIQRP